MRVTLNVGKSLRLGVGTATAALARHSEVKHSLLREYLIEYFLTLVASPHQDRIQLTVVDGFCGGGCYVGSSGTEVPGSPIVILEALREAQVRVELGQQRRKPIEFDVKLICVDESASAIDYLKRLLQEKGYGGRLAAGGIQLVRGDFLTCSEAIIAEAVKRSPRAGRAIFVLDQYGYDAVPLPTLQNIFCSLAKAEVILTFAVDALINFLSEKNLADFERKTGIDGAITAAELDKLKKSPGWRLHVQSGLYQRLTKGSGAEYFTPFFIRADRGHGDFWLLHLSRHWKARDVMASTHWKYHNHFVHYGAPGFDMLTTGYAARIDESGHAQGAFEFDDVAANANKEAMLVQIPQALDRQKGGVSFERFFHDRVNLTPATREMVAKAVLELAASKEVEILGADGTLRRVRSAIQSDHVLRLSTQKIFSFSSAG